MLYLVICLIIISCILAGLLLRKSHIDRAERNKLQDEVKDLRSLRQYAEEDLRLVKEKCEYEEHKLDECKKDL